MTAGRRTLCLTPEGRLAGSALLDDPHLHRLLEIITAGGEQARVVGGAVRNTLLGLPAADIDVATTAAPDAVLTLARRAGLRTIPTGLAHGTVTVLVGGTSFEVTTLREDVATDGRHAVVRFSRDFVADALRRDFTINALSVDADGTLHDATGGLDDLAAGRVRFIGAADQRIREDYLRILRFFRFHAFYATGPLDPEGLDWSTRHRDALSRLSRERVRAELLKLLAAPRAAPTVAAMAEAGIAARVLGAPCRPRRLARLAGIETDREAGPDPLLRLAALALDGPPDVPRLRDALRLSNDEERRLGEAGAVRQALDPAQPPPTATAARGLLFTHGRQALRDGLTLAQTEADPADDPAWNALWVFVGRAPPPKLPIGGAEVMARGVRNGRMVGAVLKRLQAAWIRAGFPDSPIELARLLEEAIASEQAER